MWYMITMPKPNFQKNNYDNHIVTAKHRDSYEVTSPRRPRGRNCDSMEEVDTSGRSNTTSKLKIYTDAESVYMITLTNKKTYTKSVNWPRKATPSSDVQWHLPQCYQKGRLTKSNESIHVIIQLDQFQISHHLIRSWKQTFLISSLRDLRHHGTRA